MNPDTEKWGWLLKTEDGELFTDIQFLFASCEEAEKELLIALQHLGKIADQYKG